MSEKRENRVGRLLLELSVVFFGVLIALAADSWWKGLADRALEAEYIAALQIDMRLARESLVANGDSTAVFLARADSAVALLSGALPPGEAWGDLGNTRAFPPSVPAGTLEALIQTGDINLLRDRELRAAVVREASAIGDSKSIFYEYLANGSQATVARQLAEEHVRANRGLPPGALAAEFLWRDPAVIASYRSYRNALFNQGVLISWMAESVEKILEAVEATRGS